MSAVAEVVTGRRRVTDYLWSPIARTVGEASWVRGNALVLAVWALAGCSSVTQAGDAMEVFWSGIEGMPAEARDLEGVPIATLARFRPQGWGEYELGRRFEVGLGLPKDEQCAAVFYSAAAQSPYDITQSASSYSIATQSTWTSAPMRQRRFGLPWARAAFRRLNVSLPVDEQAAARLRCEEVVAAAARAS